MPTTEFIKFLYADYGAAHPTASLLGVIILGALIGGFTVLVIRSLGRHRGQMNVHQKVAYETVTQTKNWGVLIAAAIGGTISGGTWHAASVDYRNAHPNSQPTSTSTTPFALSSPNPPFIQGPTAQPSPMQPPPPALPNTVTPIRQNGEVNAIGGNASDSHQAGPTSNGNNAPIIGHLTQNGSGSVGVNYGQVTNYFTTSPPAPISAPAPAAVN